MGYGWCRWRLGRELSEVRGEIMAKAEREDVDIRLDRLNEIIATKADASRVDEVRANSVTHKDLEEAIASALVDVARHYEGEGLISDTSIKLAIQDGRITGFDRDVLENAIGTDHQTRSWLERAVENGYVDVLGQEVEAHDHQGHFRSLVDEDESHAGRYVPRDGVRDVLRRYPEAFDAASDYEAQLKSWVEKSKKVSDDDIKYRKVKRDI